MVNDDCQRRILDHLARRPLLSTGELAACGWPARDAIFARPAAAPEVSPPPCPARPRSG
jgi:hypothetical protein